MARGMVALARTAVVVRAGAAPLWWLGLAAAAAGAWQDGLTGQWIGLYAGAALFVVVAPVVFAVRRGRCLERAETAERAGRNVVLQDRAVTVRAWRRARRGWLLAAFTAAAASAAAVPVACGLALAGAGAGLWAKAAWLGRWEREHEALLWLPADAVARRGAGTGGAGTAYVRTGIAAGDALPGGARRRAVVAA